MLFKSLIWPCILDDLSRIIRYLAFISLHMYVRMILYKKCAYWALLDSLEEQ